MIYLKIKSLINNTETADLFTKNDIFIEIEYGEDRRKTTTLWNTNNPNWNEIFLFSKTDIKKMTLKIKDEDVWSKDEVLMEIEIDVHYGKVKNFKTNNIEYDMGNVFYKARVINAMHKKTIKQNETTIQELSTNIEQLNIDIRHLKITNNELKTSLETVADENQTMFSKLSKIKKIVKKHDEK
jgi:hypothetical protein